MFANNFQKFSLRLQAEKYAKKIHFFSHEITIEKAYVAKQVFSRAKIKEHFLG